MRARSISLVDAMAGFAVGRLGQTTARTRLGGDHVLGRPDQGAGALLPVGRVALVAVGRRVLGHLLVILQQLLLLRIVRRAAGDFPQKALLAALVGLLHDLFDRVLG